MICPPLSTVGRSQQREIARAVIDHSNGADGSFVISSEQENGITESDMVKHLFCSVDVNSKGYLEFADVKVMMEKQLFAQAVTGRYFVVLSLSEAETLRSVLHGVKNKSINQGFSSYALLTDDMVLDSSRGHEFSASYQRETTRQCLRFLDSNTRFTDRNISMLLRALQYNPAMARRTWFEEIKSCRRRRKTAYEKSLIWQLFTMEDEYEMLLDRAFMSRMRVAIKTRGMYFYDAFRAFDVDRNGVLNCTELYSGMLWLGMTVTPENIYRLVRRIDSDRDGFVTFHDFKTSLDLYAGNVSVDKSFDEEKFQTIIPQIRIKELIDLENIGRKVSKARRLSAKDLQKFRVSLKSPNGYECAWTSRGTMSRAKCSLWIPSLKRGFMAPKHKKRICLGYYANVGYGDPRSTGVAGIELKLIELTDYTTAGARFVGSDHMEEVRNKFTPHPVRFHQKWNQQKGEKPLYAWEPIPPTDDFVALGMVITTSDTAPPVECVRVVPRKWTKKSLVVPRLVWNDAGTGGRPGSIWIINELGLLWVTSGHEPPSGPFYTAKQEKFFVGGGELTPEDDDYGDSEKTASNNVGKTLSLEEKMGMMKKKSLTPGEAARIRQMMIDEAAGGKAASSKLPPVSE